MLNPGNASTTGRYALASTAFGNRRGADGPTTSRAKRQGIMDRISTSSLFNRMTSEDWTKISTSAASARARPGSGECTTMSSPPMSMAPPSAICATQGIRLGRLVLTPELTNWRRSARSSSMTMHWYLTMGGEAPMRGRLPRPYIRMAGNASAPDLGARRLPGANGKSRQAGAGSPRRFRDRHSGGRVGEPCEDDGGHGEVLNHRHRRGQGAGPPAARFGGAAQGAGLGSSMHRRRICNRKEKRNEYDRQIDFPIRRAGRHGRHGADTLHRRLGHYRHGRRGRYSDHGHEPLACSGDSGSP